MNLRIKNKATKLIPYLFIIAFVLLIVFPQIHHRYFLSGMDYYFHMTRTYETAMQMKTGHFSYFLTLFSWGRNARIVNAMYGPLGGYVSGLLLLLTGTWLRWEIVLNAILLLIAGVSMHQLNRYWHVQPIVDLFTAFLYMISPAVFNFVFYQSFYSVGAAFIPWVILAGSRIADGHFRISRLMVIMIVITELHLLTLAISVIVLAFFAVPALVLRSNRKAIFKKLIISTVLTLILTFNVWGALLGVSLSNRDHLLLTFPNVWRIGGKAFNTIMNTYPHTSIWQTPSELGLLLCILIIIAVVAWLVRSRRCRLSFNVIAITGICFLLMSSKYFPWAFLQQKAPIIDTIVQFPSRFLSVGLVSSYLVFGKLITNHRKIVLIPGMFLLVATVSYLWFNNYQTTVQRGQHFYSKAVIDWRNMRWNYKRSAKTVRRSLLFEHLGQPDQFTDMLVKPIADYLPTSAKYTDNDPQGYMKINPYRGVRTQLLRHPSRSLSYKVRLQNRAEENIAVNSTERQRTQIPFIKYRHTVVRVNGRQIDPRISNVGAMTVPLKAGCNHVMIYYRPSLKYEAGLIVSLIVWIITLMNGLCDHFDPDRCIQIKAQLMRKFNIK